MTRGRRSKRNDGGGKKALKATRPAYKLIKDKDTLVIGIRHDADLRLDSTGRERFMHQIAPCQHFLFEGVEEDKANVIGSGVENYETTAYLENRDNHFLEADARFRFFARQYGVRDNLFSLYDVLSMLQASRMYLGNRPGLVETLTEIGAKGGAYFDPVTLGEDKERAESDLKEKLRVTLNTFEGDLDSLDAVANAFGLFFVGVRDVEILGPRATSLADTLDGRKGLLVGRLHYRSICAALEGRNLPRPKDWDVYVAGLKGPVKNNIYRIEQELFPL